MGDKRLFNQPLDKTYTERYNIPMDNKETIVKNAIDLFSSKGYDAVGVQELVDASAITKPTLYHYFGSKKGLLDHILEEGFAELTENVKQACIYAHDITKTLTDLANVFFNFAKEHRDFYRMSLSFYFSPPESEANIAATKYHGAIYDTVETVFKWAGHDHGNMKGRHREYAASFIGLLNTYIGMFLNGYVVFDNELIYKIIHQFMHGIFS